MSNAEVMNELVVAVGLGMGAFVLLALFALFVVPLLLTGYDWVRALLRKKRRG